MTEAQAQKHADSAEPLPFTELGDSADDPDELLGRFREDGYLMLRQCLDPAAVTKLRHSILAAVSDLDWVTSPEDATAIGPGRFIGDESYWPGLSDILRVPEVYSLPRTGRLSKVLAVLFGGSFFLHPRRVPRVVFPASMGDGSETVAHQDFPYVQGALDTVTAWIPLGDCARNDGGLEVLRGSHLNGLRPVLGGVKNRCAATRVDPRDGQWRGGTYEAGDVLLFSSLTVHRARANRSDRVRLSMDCRFQPAHAPISSSELEPAFYPNVPSWDRLLPADRVWATAVPDSATVVTATDPTELTEVEPGVVFPWLRSEGYSDAG